MKLRIALATATAALSLAAFVPAAHAGRVCYGLQVNVQGQQVVDEAGCQDLP